MRQRLFLAALVTLVAASAPVTAADDPATTKGTQIGTVISTAINTALPGISSLAKAIVGIFAPKPTPQQQTAVTSATKQATDTMKKQIADQVKTIEPLETQLNALAPFIQYGFRGNADLSALIEYISTTKVITDQQWRTTVAPMWGKVQAELDLIKISPDDLDKQIVDLELREMLENLLEVKAVSGKAIGLLISAKARDELASELTKLSDSLSTLHVVARVQLRNIASQIDVLVKWSNGLNTAQGAPHLPKEVVEDITTAKQVLGRATADSKAIVEKMTPR
jgi:hypothetical protein